MMLSNRQPCEKSEITACDHPIEVLLQIMNLEKIIPDVVMCNGNYGALRFFYSRRARFRVTQR